MTQGKRAPGKSSAHKREPSPIYVGQPAFWRATDSPDRNTPLLLDTHVWLWMLDGTKGALTKSTVRLIENASAAGMLYASDVSFWEVALLVSKGRLELGVDPTIWLHRAATAPGIKLLALSRDVLIESNRLAGAPHGDPADRMLIAQAQLIGASLMTCDKGIVAYAARTPGIPVCDAR